MKKTLIVASLAMLLAVAGLAGANTLIVPFFADSTEPPDYGGLAGFIQLKNLEADPIIVMVEYTDAAGLDGSPGENTFELPGATSLGWRPVIDDPGLEGEASLGRAVPNALPVGTLARGNGGVTISATGRIVGAAIAWNFGTNMGWSYPAAGNERNSE